MSNTSSNGIAIKYLERAYGIKASSIYQKHIPYMLKNKLYLYSKDRESTTKKISRYTNVTNNEAGIKEIKTNIRHELVPKKQLKSHLQVCKEYSSLMFGEKVDFKVSEGQNKKTAVKEIEYLQKHYQAKDLWSRLENALVDVFGIGTVAIVTSYDETWGIQNTFYDAYCVLPLTIIDNKIKEAVFIGTDAIDNTKIKISLHRINWSIETYITDDVIPEIRANKKENGYIIDTITLDNNGNVIENESKLNRMSPVRLFTILKPFNRNSYDYANCFGVPVYEDSKDVCLAIDDLFDAQQIDLSISQNTLLASKKLFQDPITNELVIPDRLNNSNCVLLGDDNPNSLESKPIVSVENQPTKINEYSQTLNEDCKMLSSKSGLGSETFSLNKISTPTATQVISDNGIKFISLKKHFNQMRDEFSILHKGILFLATENTINKSLNYEILITFNTADNILVDDETLKEKALDDYQAGTMSLYSYLTEYRKLSGQELIDELERLGYDKDGKKQNDIDAFNLFNTKEDKEDKEDDKGNDDTKNKGINE